MLRRSASATMRRTRARGADTAADDQDRTLGRLDQLERGRAELVVWGRGRKGGTEANCVSTRPSISASSRSIWPSLPRNWRWTGPGAPVVAARNACRSMSGNRSTASTVALNLVTGLEGRYVVDLLVDLAELGVGVASAGHGDHRRVRQVGITQTSGQVEGADHLGHADARVGPRPWRSRRPCRRPASRRAGGSA